jgi:hypothetical protein
VKDQNKSEGQEINGDDTTERERVTDQNDRKFIAGLRIYFLQEGNGGSRISALETWVVFVLLQPIERTRQGTLDQFLPRH